MTVRAETDASLKARACQVIDEQAEALIALAEDIYRHPELGFKEVRTAGLVAERLTALGIPCETGLALTGVKGIVAGGAPGPTVAVLGELDSLAVSDHPAADPATGAAHACGHNGQIAMMIGAVTGLVRADVLPSLSGRIACMSLPA